MEKLGEVLFLSRDDIECVLTPKDALEICDQTFKWVNAGEIDQLNVGPLNMPRIEGYKGAPRFRVYPAHVKPLGAVGMKWLSVYPHNPPRRLPFSMAVDILNDFETSAPVAIMEGMSITSMRTAGFAAVGAKYLAKKDTEIIAVIGCGFEGRTHLRLMNELFKIKEVRACDMFPAVREMFCREMGEKLGLNIVPSKTIEEAVKCSDVICEVTTSENPTLSPEWVEPGQYIAASNIWGAGPELMRMVDKWVLGNVERDLSWIEANPAYPKDSIYAGLDEIVARKKPGRENDEEIILLTHHGMSALDISTMRIVYERALQKGVGTKLKLF